MKTIKGPAIFLAQFVSSEPPFSDLKGLANWASTLGFVGVQLPTNHRHIFDLSLAAESKTYCDEIAGTLSEHGLTITELSTHLQGQLVAVHPVYDSLFDSFAPSLLRGRPKERQSWAVEQLKFAASASEKLGLESHATFSGSLLWPYIYPWPQRLPHLVEDGFIELSRRWHPILDVFDSFGIDLCFELHPGEDLHDGTTFERFLELTNEHKRANVLYDPSHQILQGMDYLAFIDIYHERIRAFHVKDGELQSSGRSGVYGGYQEWLERPGRFRTPGDGQVDFSTVFSKLTQYGYSGWAVLEWEDCLKNSDDGARDGAAFIRRHIIKVSDRAFDDFAGGTSNRSENRKLLGLD
jgi:sugar phosphate isomerase/epimerase